MKADDYSFPVYGTQGGGLAREVRGIFIFVEAPRDFPELTVGSEVPAEWGLAAANQLAIDHDEGFDDPIGGRWPGLL